jgi:glutamine synthetase
VFEEAVGTVLMDLVKENKRIIFNGNNYAEEWQQEAQARGLLNLRNTVDALPELIKPEVVRTFERYKVLNERELRARVEINFEAYNKSINVEAQLMTLMANRYILPGALNYQTQIAQNVAAMKAAGASAFAGSKLLDSFSALVDEFKARTDDLTAALEHQANDGVESHARYFRDMVVPKMAALRETGDKIELLVPSDDWPLPTYREMLFIK